MKVAVSAIFRSRIHRLLAPFTRGVGAVLMLHSVSPEPAKTFNPNGLLTVTPEFLDRAINVVRREGYDIVSLDEAHQRLLARKGGRPFVCFTLDDGYLDNLEHAYRIFTRQNVPFCIYVPAAFADGRADLWWYKLEAALGAGRTLRLELNGTEKVLNCATPALQQQAWDAIYWWLRGVDEDLARAKISDLCVQAGVDAARAVPALMTWEQISRLAADPLCTIGAHTTNHYSLGKLDATRCREEIVGGKRILEERLGRPVRHFSYPYGGAADCGPREFAMSSEVGFATAVTTHKGLLFPEHREHLTALPRLSLNGNAQREQILALLLGGAPFAVMNGFRRVPV